MTYSYSRLSTYDECPFKFYVKYIEKRDGISNFYAENGSINHSIFQRLLKKEITLEEAPTIYQEEFDNICETTRQSTMDSTFEKCITYLCEVEEFDFEKYEILSCEDRLDFKIGKYNFVAYIDLLIRDKETGCIILIDHKSSDKMFGVKGQLLKNKVADYEKYRKQMYIYCYAVEKIFGLKIDDIFIHHFKCMGALTRIEFDKEEYEKAIAWCVSTIEKIKKDTTFEPKKSFMMCRNLCDFREDCEYLDEEE